MLAFHALSHLCIAISLCVYVCCCQCLRFSVLWLYLTQLFSFVANFPMRMLDEQMDFVQSNIFSLLLPRPIKREFSVFGFSLFLFSVDSFYSIVYYVILSPLQ